MKKLIIFFLLNFVFMQGAFALTDDERFKKAKELHPEAVGLADVTEASTHVFVTGVELKQNERSIENFFEKSKERGCTKTFIVDFKRGDGFVGCDGNLEMPLFIYVKNLYLYNFSEDIVSIRGNAFLCRASLEELTMVFPRVVTIKSLSFLFRATRLDTLRLDFPMLETFGSMALECNPRYVYLNMPRVVEGEMCNGSSSIVSIDGKVSSILMEKITRRFCRSDNEVVRNLALFEDS